jgi:hypothetical protein
MLSGGLMFSTCGLRPASALLISSGRQACVQQVGAAHVDAEHQVEALHRRGRRGRQADRAGVVDQDVDAAEALHRRLHRGGHGALVADVGLHRQRLAAGGLDLGRALYSVPGSLGLGSVVLASSTMLAPSRAARLAIARPMPRLAPVMSSVLPLQVRVMDGSPTSGIVGHTVCGQVRGDAAAQ